MDLRVDATGADASGLKLEPFVAEKGAGANSAAQALPLPRLLRPQSVCCVDGPTAANAECSHWDRCNPGSGCRDKTGREAEGCAEREISGARGLPVTGSWDPTAKADAKGRTLPQGSLQLRHRTRGIRR